MPIPLKAAKHARTLAREDVYAQLCTWIIEGVLQPEEQLRDQDIAGRLGVSRTPVREALRRLEDEGFVETALNRWTRVAPLRVDQAAQLYPVIEALEVLALRLAAPRLTMENLALLETINTQLQQALTTRDARGAVQADTDFHAVWISRSGNGELQQTLGTLKRKLQRVELAYFNVVAAGEASVREHGDLLTALHNKDAESAREALQRNWNASLRRLGLTLDP